MQVIDERIKEWATPRQAEFIDAVNAHGGQRAAARALGVAKSTIDGAIQRARIAAAHAGYAPDHDMTHVVPDGFRVKGVNRFLLGDFFSMSVSEKVFEPALWAGLLCRGRIAPAFLRYSSSSTSVMIQSSSVPTCGAP